MRLVLVAENDIGTVSVAGYNSGLDIDMRRDTCHVYLLQSAIIINNIIYYFLLLLFMIIGCISSINRTRCTSLHRTTATDTYCFLPRLDVRE